jgi:hypothetical protein
MPLLEACGSMEAIADIIYEAPIAILAHNRFSEGVEDNEAVFTFANKVRRMGSLRGACMHADLEAHSKANRKRVRCEVESPPFHGRGLPL